MNPLNERLSDNADSWRRYERKSQVRVVVVAPGSSAMSSGLQPGCRNGRPPSHCRRLIVLWRWCQGYTQSAPRVALLEWAASHCWIRGSARGQAGVFEDLESICVLGQSTGDPAPPLPSVRSGQFGLLTGE